MFVEIDNRIIRLIVELNNRKPTINECNILRIIRDDISNKKCNEYIINYLEQQPPIPILSFHYKTYTTINNHFNVMLLFEFSMILMQLIDTIIMNL